MADAQEWSKSVREKMEAAHGFHELGLHHDAWTVLDHLTLTAVQNLLPPHVQNLRGFVSTTNPDQVIIDFRGELLAQNVTGFGSILGQKAESLYKTFCTI